MGNTRRAGALATVAALALSMMAVTTSPATAQDAAPPPTPKAVCGPGSEPETGRQGRVPLADHQSGRAAKGYTCNTRQLSHIGNSGGYKVERYVDAAGHECAFFDSTLLFPLNVPTAGTELTGVWVLDMTDPTKPVKTANLLSPAMQTPHESLVLNQKRGLLAAVLGNPAFYPGVVDIYDVSADCRHPVLKSSVPVAILGHESGFAPDGNTFYAASLHSPHVTAIDVSNPSVPVTLWVGDFYSHGLQVSDDGTRVYMAARRGVGPNDGPGLLIVDVSEIQSRTLNPQAHVVGSLTWPMVSTPQNALPIRIQGHPYVLEIDEFASGDRVGAARIIDIADERNPRVVSDIRLEVNQPENRASQMADPGASFGLQGYAGHYCNVPTRQDPGVVACTFIVSGLRLFDIRDPLKPKEIAYYNAPTGDSINPTEQYGSSYAMSSPAFVPERGEVWYTDGNSGFYALKVTNGVWPFGSDSGGVAAAVATPAGAVSGTGGTSTGGGGVLAASGPALPFGVVGASLLGAGLLLQSRLRQRRRFVR